MNREPRRPFVSRDERPVGFRYPLGQPLGRMQLPSHAERFVRMQRRMTRTPGMTAFSIFFIIAFVFCAVVGVATYLNFRHGCTERGGSVQTRYVPSSEDGFVQVCVMKDGSIHDLF